ncbi:hypothetical protein F5Y04DRAFT_279633 [Hypomontagnella monticulosa]|nr:hypothetical protein F5Y04DRAFT_279633 [Hypomontagnella monticulosa]
MERDVRRDRSQWRGCHTFNNIICDGDQVGNQKRSGGLRMGQKYYYYYEVDGSTETYDASMPTTNACPYLPGQTVNTLEVPQEHSLSRNRSASMNSLRTTDFKTMDPDDKFVAPRPAPPVPSLPDLRIGSSPAMSLVHKRSTRSLSPAPSWTSTARRFLRRKRTFTADSDAGSETEVESHYAEELREPRSATPAGSIRSRDMSPESLRRFLSDDLPETPAVVEQPKLFIPDEIIEENEDDDNFATSAVSETAPFTMLSPPPFQRSLSSSTTASTNSKYNNSGSTSTIVPTENPQNEDIAFAPTDVPPIMTNFALDAPRSHFSFSTISSSVVSPNSPRSIGSRDLNQFSFFDDSEDEGEGGFSTEDDPFTTQGSRRPSERSIPKHIHSPITGYSLPQPTSGEKHLNTGSTSPDLVARLDSGVALGNPNLLGRPGIDTGLDDLVNDMGWMADVIQPKFI